MKLTILKTYKMITWKVILILRLNSSPIISDSCILFFGYNWFIPLLVRTILFSGHKVCIDKINNFITAKNSICSKLIGCIVYSSSCNISKDFSCLEICVSKIVKHNLCTDYIIIAILSNLNPLTFRYRLIPRMIPFEMLYTKSDFPFLQSLLIRCKVKYICVRKIVSLTKLSFRIIGD